MCMSAAHSSHHTRRSQVGEKVEVVQDVKGTASEGQEEQWCPATVVSPPKSGSSLRVRLHGDDVASGCAPVSAPTPRHKPLFSSTPGPRGRAHAVVRARRPISARDWRWQSSSEHGSAALGVGEHVYVLVGPRGGREWREAQVREAAVEEEAVKGSDGVSSARPPCAVVVDGVRPHPSATRSPPAPRLSLSSLPLPLAPGPARPCLAPAPTAPRARCPPWQDEAWIKLLRHEDEGRLWRRRQAGCVFVESVNELGLGLALTLTLTLTR